MEIIDSQYSESSSVTFEWTLSGLKALFDSTKGDKKSKVTKSIRFGNNRWQILFYANAGPTKDGTEGGGFVSLYLSCEPTAEEKEASLSDSGRWVREGVYKFSFELRNVGKNIVYNAKEAHNHSFTYKTANWGWAQFARRDSVYYQSLPVKSQDAFVIICSITSSPASPSSHPLPPRQPVPKALLDTVGSLLDDPLYSDVQFIIPRRNQSIANGKEIWASKKLLQRADYFQTMFSSNFVEGSFHSGDHSTTPRLTSHNIRRSPPHLYLILDEFEDSDNDDEEEDEPQPSHSPASPQQMDDFGGLFVPDSNHDDFDKLDAQSTGTSDQFGSPKIEPSSIPNEVPKNADSKMTIVVQDAAYNTYRAMLYYLYTDNVVFAPLSSSFTASSQGHGPPVSSADSVPSTPSDGSQIQGTKRVSPRDLPSSRAEWIRDWMASNPGRPAPCSAKSMYRIADRLDMPDLKERAAQHILKSLTVDNIGYEVFSPFAAAFETIRKAEVDFFLAHWHDIRSSETMKNVWLQIRNGRHPGFEEVWPLIAQSLEFKPSTPAASASSPKTVDTII